MKKNNIFSFFFGSNFKFYFIKNNSCMILKKKICFFFLNFPSNFFYKIKFILFSFIFLNYFHFISFFKHILQLYNKLSSFYYLRLKLKGLGYRIVHLSKLLIKIFFNRSNFFYIHIPTTILFRYKIRRLFFLSTKLVDLRNLMINFLL